MSNSEATDRHTRRAVLAGVCGITAGGLTASNSGTNAGAPRTQTTAQTVDKTSTDLRAVIEDRLTEADVRGAAVAVVVDGEVVLADGFGEAEPGRPVSPTTPFRVASVSKPVVGTAVAELAARDVVALETPVREVLAAELVTWDEPVTLRHLMTHTGGFEVTNRSLWYPSPEHVESLPEHLTPMPEQVRTPGGVGVYSNHGIGLAGQVLAATLAQPFPAAMEATVFAPAGMTEASFAQPLPDELSESHAATGGLTRVTVEGRLAGIGPAPAGALSVSAASMARFLKLHCNDGRLNGEQILHPEAIEIAHRRWFSHHEAIDGMALGFIEDHYGDTRILTHDGASPFDGFTSQLRVVPDHEIGVFVAYNGNALELGLADAVLEELLPAPSQPSHMPSAPHRGDELPGTYRSLRRGVRAHDSLLTTLTAGSVTVSLADDGALLVENGNDTHRWIEIEPLVFEREDGARRLAFDTDEAGELTRLFIGGTPTAYVQRDWYESATLHGGALLGGLVGVWWTYDNVKPDRRYTESRREYIAKARAAPNRAAALIATLGTGAFVAYLSVILGSIALGNTRFVVGFLTDPSGLLSVAAVLPVIGGLAALGIVFLLLYSLHTGCLDRHSRRIYAMTASVVIGLTAFLWYWNFFPV